MKLNVFAEKIVVQDEKNPKKNNSFFKVMYRKVDNVNGDSYIQIKFKQECGLPKFTETGYYLLDVNQEDMSLQNKSYITKDGSKGIAKIIWLSSFNSCVRNIAFEEELKRKQAEELALLFNE